MAEVIAAVALRREIEGEWVLFLVGILSVVLGVAMAVLPGVGLLSLVWLIGLYALVVGVALIVLAFVGKLFQHDRRVYLCVMAGTWAAAIFDFIKTLPAFARGASVGVTVLRATPRSPPPRPARSRPAGSSPTRRRSPGW